MQRLPFLDALAWPETEALRMLRKGSAVINIRDEDVLALTDRWEVVYSNDPPARWAPDDIERLRHQRLP